MQSSHTFTVGSAVFDEPNLVSAAGLVPIMELAEQTGLSRLFGACGPAQHPGGVSGAVNAAGKLTTIIAGMMGCGADSIDDVNVLRAGGTPRVFDEVYAPSTLGSTCCASSPSGIPTSSLRWPASIWRRSAQRTPLLPGASRSGRFWTSTRCCAQVYGQPQKQGATFGHAKIAGRALLRKGLSPLITTLSVAQGGAGDRRGVAAQRQDRLRARRRPAGQAGHRHHPRVRGGGKRKDHVARRLGIRHEEGHRRLP